MRWKSLRLGMMGGLLLASISSCPIPVFAEETRVGSGMAWQTRGFSVEPGECVERFTTLVAETSLDGDVGDPPVFGFDIRIPVVGQIPVVEAPSPASTENASKDTAPMKDSRGTFPVVPFYGVDDVMTDQPCIEVSLGDPTPEWRPLAKQGKTALKSASLTREEAIELPLPKIELPAGFRGNIHLLTASSIETCRLTRCLVFGCPEEPRVRLLLSRQRKSPLDAHGTGSDEADENRVVNTKPLGLALLEKPPALEGFRLCKPASTSPLRQKGFLETFQKGFFVVSDEEEQQDSALKEPSAVGPFFFQGKFPNHRAWMAGWKNAANELHLAFCLKTGEVVESVRLFGGEGRLAGVADLDEDGLEEILIDTAPENVPPCLWLVRWRFDMPQVIPLANTTPSGAGTRDHRLLEGIGVSRKADRFTPASYRIIWGDSTGVGFIPAPEAAIASGKDSTTKEERSFFLTGFGNEEIQVQPSWHHPTLRELIAQRPIGKGNDRRSISVDDPLLPPFFRSGEFQILTWRGVERSKAGRRWLDKDGSWQTRLHVALKNRLSADEPQFPVFSQGAQVNARLGRPIEYKIEPPVRKEFFKTLSRELLRLNPTMGNPAGRGNLPGDTDFYRGRFPGSRDLLGIFQVNPQEEKGPTGWGLFFCRKDGTIVDFLELDNHAYAVHWMADLDGDGLDEIMITSSYYEGGTSWIISWRNSRPELHSIETNGS